MTLRWSASTRRHTARSFAEPFGRVRVRLVARLRAPGRTRVGRHARPMTRRPQSNGPCRRTQRGLTRGALEWPESFAFLQVTGATHVANCAEPRTGSTSASAFAGWRKDCSFGGRIGAAQLETHSSASCERTGRRGPPEHLLLEYARCTLLASRARQFARGRPSITIELYE